MMLSAPRIQRDPPARQPRQSSAYAAIEERAIGIERARNSRVVVLFQRWSRGQ